VTNTQSPPYSLFSSSPRTTPHTTPHTPNTFPGVSTLQDTIFGPGTSAQPTQSEQGQGATPSDPRLQQAPKESIEEAIRDQHRSGPPKELLKEANSEKREQERKKEEGGGEGKA